jgi:hypothetical protein
MYQGGAFASFKLDTQATVVGLSDGRENGNWQNIDYGWHPDAAGNFHSNVNGSFVNHGTAANGVTFDRATTHFAVAYDGANILWLADGVIIRQLATTADRSFAFGVSHNQATNVVSEIQFGPFSVGSRAGTNLYRADGSTVMSQAEVRTPEGTAAAIASQGALATLNAANLDTHVTDGSTYGRLLGSQLSSGAHKLTVAGSGARVGDQRNLPQIATMNLRYKWTGAITYSAASNGTATISVGAATVPIGSLNISYNAMSVGVTGTAGTSVTYFLYFDDAAYAGGAKTLVATTDGTTVYQNDGRVWVGTVTVAYPSSGTTSGSGGSGGGGGTPPPPPGAGDWREP